MTDITVSLPDPLADWCDRQVSAGRYADTGAYVRGLIERDRSRAEVQAAIDEGLASGLSDKSLDEIMAAARVRVSPDGR
ncbi:ribbon-helix-helix domain-containing protein [Roseospira navarrensis]|uniref:Type II toxin-antitoxin system ParD family antitoxin n=1 Tax=Roseospira navarrensis TaxID=140058 RepID=A0A7X1ZGP2_9PROT|nr:type II toxin-antitoxin system ParD family antitoxin [Roseospira navarrensis]MQX38135.1 type II toxin-antitoxin system ParD family antitoxin [Roseospira navarrensis]